MKTYRMGKSLARKPAAASHDYRGGYLRSRSWFTRRRMWLAAEQIRKGKVVCAICDSPLTERTAELHHFEYTGVTQSAEGQWRSQEKHEDLVAFCKSDHEALHRVLDRDAGWAMVGRRAATDALIRKLRIRLAQLVEEQLQKARTQA